MIIGPRKRLLRVDTVPHVFINNQIIDRVDNTKTLGDFIDENITWKNWLLFSCLGQLFGRIKISTATIAE